MLPKIPSVSTEQPGIKHACPLSTGLSLKTCRDGLQQSRLTFFVTPHQFSPAVSKRHTIFLFSYHFAFYQKNKNKKKTLTLSTSQTRIINILFLTIFAMNRMNPVPIPPLEQTPLYTVYSTYQQFLFSLFAFYIIIKVVSIALKYIQCSFHCNYNHYPDCTYSIISYSQSLMSSSCASFDPVVTKYSKEKSQFSGFLKPKYF